MASDLPTATSRLLLMLRYRCLYKLSEFSVVNNETLRSLCVAVYTGVTGVLVMSPAAAAGD